MMKIQVVIANASINIGGKEVFTKGESYIKRRSKGGDKVLIQDKFGVWQVMVNEKFTTYFIQMKKLHENFTTVKEFNLKNWLEYQKLFG